MARIFTVYFSFEHKEYHSVVSVRTTPFFTEYSLLNLPDALVNLLPDTKILSRGPDHFVFPNPNINSSVSLMDSIAKAVAQHLLHYNA